MLAVPSSLPGKSRTSSVCAGERATVCVPGVVRPWNCIWRGEPPPQPPLDRRKPIVNGASTTIRIKNLHLEPARFGFVIAPSAPSRFPHSRGSRRCLLAVTPKQASRASPRCAWRARRARNPHAQVAVVLHPLRSMIGAHHTVCADPSSNSIGPSGAPSDHLRGATSGATGRPRMSFCDSRRRSMSSYPRGTFRGPHFTSC
jgi:hypothetical protein